MYRRRTLILLRAASALWFAAMAAFVELRLAPQGATPLPDTSLTGHTADGMAERASGMTDAGRTLFLGSYRLLDTVFPLLLALTLAVTGGLRHGWLGALALACALFDLAENATIARIVPLAPVPPGPDIVNRASLLTITQGATVLPATLAGAWLLAASLKGRPCGSP